MIPIATLLFYVWVTVGVTVAVHYCGGEPVSATVVDGLSTDEACCCGDLEPMEGCCATSVTTFHLSDDHTASAEWCAPQQDAGTVVPVAASPAASPATRPALALSAPASPPTPSHILHCALLI